MIALPTVYPVTSHTNYVGPGSTFVAIKGVKEDGASYISQAIDRGATTIVLDRDTELMPDVRDRIGLSHVAVIRVDNTRLALSQLSAQAAGYPAKKLTIFGVTGTKGKTTTSFLLKHIVQTAGYKTALLSSVKNIIGSEEFSAPLTTAQPDYIHQFLKLCVENGITHVVMEVAAQALSLHRVSEISFDGVIFTNFSQEHLEFYTDLQDYFAAKYTLFSQKKAHAPAIVNGDDMWLQQRCKDISPAVWFGIRNAPISIDIMSSGADALNWNVSTQTSKNQFSCPALIGSFNVYNATAALLLARSFGISDAHIHSALATFTPVPGRLERYTLSNGALCIIDYANGPMAYQVVLSLLRACTSQLIVVFGAGGDRDASKRPLMGAYAAQYSDVVVVTSDNPRTEDPEAIMDAVIAGIPAEKKDRLIREGNRELAIKKAYACSHAGSIIALLGKGPDEYQIVGMTKYPFSEKQIIAHL